MPYHTNRKSYHDTFNQFNQRTTNGGPSKATIHTNKDRSIICINKIEYACIEVVFVNILLKGML